MVNRRLIIYGLRYPIYLAKVTNTMFKNLIAASLMYSTVFAEPSGQAVPQGNGVIPDSEILKLRRLVMDQQDKVDEHRKVLETISKTKNTICKGNQGSQGDEKTDSPEDEEAMKRYEREVIRLSQIELDITRLDCLEGDELIRKAAEIKVDGNPFALVSCDSETNGNSDVASPSPKDENVKLAKLRQLLESEKFESQKRLHEIQLKRAVYVCADDLYENEKQRLELMQAALSRAEARNAPNK